MFLPLSVVMGFGHISVGAHGSQRDCVLYSWELQVLVSCPMWVLGTKPALTHPAISPAPCICILYVYDGFYILESSLWLNFFR